MYQNYKKNTLDCHLYKYKNYSRLMFVELKLLLKKYYFTQIDDLVNMHFIYSNTFIIFHL